MHEGVRSPKTSNSYRTIVVDEIVMKQLKNYLKWCKEALLSNGQKLKDDLSKDNTLIFIAQDSCEPISPNNTPNFFNKILKRTGLPKTTIHGLRHTHATVLLNRGLNVKVIAERLGNTPQMIYTVYGHIFEELEKEAATFFKQSLDAVVAKNGANY